MLHVSKPSHRGAPLSTEESILLFHDSDGIVGRDAQCSPSSRSPSTAIERSRLGRGHAVRPSYTSDGTASKHDMATMKEYEAIHSHTSTKGVSKHR